MSSHTRYFIQLADGTADPKLFQDRFAATAAFKSREDAWRLYRAVFDPKQPGTPENPGRPELLLSKRLPQQGK